MHAHTHTHTFIRTHTVVLVLGSTDRPGPAVDTYPIMAATWEFAVPGLTAGYPLLENG